MRSITFFFTGALLLFGSSAYAAEKAAPADTPPPAAPSAVKDDEQTPSGTKTEQLAAEQKKLNVMRLRYDEKHPAFVKQRAKVIRLQKEARAEEPNPAPTDRAGQLAIAKRDLEEMLKRYTEKHPTVIAQRKKIAELEAAR